MSNGKTITVYVSDLTMRRLEHALQNLVTWQSIEELASSAVSESALDYAKQNGGPME